MAGTELGRTAKLHFFEGGTKPALDTGYTYAGEIVNFSVPLTGGEVENRFLNTTFVDYLPTGVEATLEGTLKNFAGNAVAKKFRKGAYLQTDFWFMVVEDAAETTPVEKVYYRGFFTDFSPTFENDAPREADFTVRVREIQGIDS